MPALPAFENTHLPPSGRPGVWVGGPLARPEGAIRISNRRAIYNTLQDGENSPLRTRRGSTGRYFFKAVNSFSAVTGSEVILTPVAL